MPSHCLYPPFPRLFKTVTASRRRAILSMDIARRNESSDVTLAMTRRSPVGIAFFSWNKTSRPTKLFGWFTQKRTLAVGRGTISFQRDLLGRGWYSDAPFSESCEPHKAAIQEKLLDPKVFKKKLNNTIWRYGSLSEGNELRSPKWKKNISYCPSLRREKVDIMPPRRRAGRNAICLQFLDKRLVFRHSTVKERVRCYTADQVTRWGGGVGGVKRPSINYLCGRAQIPHSTASRDRRVLSEKMMT